MIESVASSRHGKRPDCHYCFALFQVLYRARPHLRPLYHETWMERKLILSRTPPAGAKKETGEHSSISKNVRAKGLEPIRTKAPDPKSGLATNYNTLANPFRKTHNMKPIAEYDLVGSCRILCPKRNAKIVKDFQFSKQVRIFVKNTEKNTIFVHRKDK